ncbi:MAG: PTS sugar transporter subunit IIA [Proteobacteria bacterium]|nr:PTS sugar transporter subunit IIA [Pseudomonadota bacterium]MDA0862210.1 PTS sugar transporter subunit IIA [Pseudomonadota bacterium]MDA1030250.1 PTS sugar transporter subunit IIA [Pseudomonadota bacterium]
MVGIVLITHGSLGQSLIDCAKHVIGDPLKNIIAVGINGSASIEAMTKQAAEAISKVDDGSGIIVLTDMYGGSPSNITKKLLESDNIYGVSGVNLPMLIRVLTYREKDIKTLIKKGLSGGSEGVMQIPLK